METKIINKKYHYGTLHERAKNINKAVIMRARKLSSEAGIDSQLLGIHPHNALVSLHYGKPWKNVDYKKVKIVDYLITVKCFRGYQLLNSLYNRGRTYFNSPETY